MQRINEEKETITAYRGAKEVNELIALRLSQNYISIMEIIWKRLKQVILLAGLNKKKKYITIPILLKKLEHIEAEYNLNLKTIKNYVDSELRNFIGHESSMFHPPNQIICLDINGKEVKRMTTDEIYGLLFHAFVILTAFASVDNTALASRLELLLRLNNEELNEFTTTGVLTEAMQKKIEIG